ncbi:MAG: hypothetical protein A2026_15075 [Deltaproteobacteria bacterium RBG_19FT_COMBO_46_12]|nr:MAG: hypothetical protein A2026_15075 [Deltaproteobacteria bacterium RBG_19FT_COMBO_46_12]
MAGGRAFRERKERSSVSGASGAFSPLFFNRVEKKREHRERAAQTRKRKVKLKRLIRNIPKEGASAKAKLKERKK